MYLAKLKTAYAVAATLLLAAAQTCAQEGATAGGVDALAYPGPAWSPYVAGALIGVLAWFTMSLSKREIGASSAYAALGGITGKAVAPGYTAKLPYFRDNPPSLNWSVVFVGSVVIGSFIAAVTGGEWTGRWLPPIWEDRFGEGTFGLRALVAFLGGVAMAFGARLAGGCTSGHGISGSLQLNVASWLALVCFFLGGMAMAFPLYQW